MSTKLSVYILTFNSERRIEQVLKSVTQVADEIVIVDSGSKDGTLDIVKKFNVQLLHRKFDNFRDQRVYAEDACVNDWCFALDSDEVLSAELITRIRALKQQDFKTNASLTPDGFSVKRNWYFCDKPVTNFYPVRTPEFIVRLFNKRKISTKGSRIIHESIQFKPENIQVLSEPILHFSCDSVADLYDKLNLYTSLSAQDMQANGETSSWVKINIYPWLIWLKWYFLNRSWQDGRAGLILCKYVRITIYLKYLKLSELLKS